MILPDTAIAWTTAASLIVFGWMFFDDPNITGRTIFMLGTIIVADEALKAMARRSHAQNRFRRTRSALAMVYVVLMLLGFFVPGIVAR